MIRISQCLILSGLVVISAGASAGCKKKVTSEQCDQLIARYASLVVKERFKEASPDVIRAEQEREQSEAKSDDNFKNCTTELSTDDYACAMGAASADAFEKCLE